MKTSQKKKRCYFFCCEGAVEDKHVRESVKSQYFELDIFFVKRDNMENKAD